MKESQESIREIAKLVAIAKKDGYRSDLEPDAVFAAAFLALYPWRASRSSQ